MTRPVCDVHLSLYLVVIVVTPLESEASRDQVRLETECWVMVSQPVQPRVLAHQRTLDLHHGLVTHETVRRGRQEALPCVHPQSALVNMLSRL